MDKVVELLQQTMTSPWVYIAIFAVAVVDGFFPIVPSETSVITAGVFAATGKPNLVALIGVAAAGAFVGDHISYAIGRGLGRNRRNKALLWAKQAVSVRGGLILVAARYIPGGRTAITMTMGSVGYPLRKFVAYDALAATSWAVYSALIGYFGGMAFENDPLRGLLLGLGLALSITAIAELVRWIRKKRRVAQELLRNSSCACQDLGHDTGQDSEDHRLHHPGCPRASVAPQADGHAAGLRTRDREHAGRAH